MGGVRNGSIVHFSPIFCENYIAAKICYGCVSAGVGLDGCVL